ncbi:HSF-type DNA-binding protein [Nitzschia inconspicua]|uniref:HSF-type DNA-binding protein n=1 Tax=Nitzschia inconspicua TaxID=303405 RepID=A0A9K3LMZ9_9STRA|nr:HSF-type DNA-binding protein [Nitzschia inconspicua]
MSSASLTSESNDSNDATVTTSTYGDFSPLNNEEHDQSIAKGGVTTPFPWKLHIMLDHMEDSGDKSIVCWQPHGRAFIVHKPKEFVTQIMPRFFNQSKYASFQRQLNLYGFSRLSHGRDKGAYFHACFVRGERDLCRKMIRQKIKGTKVRKSLSPEEEPNFYTMSGNLPTIPSEESMAEQQQEQTKKNRQSAAANNVSPPRSDPHEVTPVSVKPVKRSPARRSSSTASVTYPIVVQQQRQPPSATAPYAMLPNPIQPLRSPPTRTVSPHQSSKTLNENTFQPLGQQLYQLPYVPEVARGGDLLFFEGQPFRYLEHIEPSTTLSTSSPLTTSNDPVRNSSLEDRVATIVNFDADFPTHHYHQQPQQMRCTNYSEKGSSHNICSV